MAKDAEAGLASPKKSAVKAKELSTDTAYINLKKGDDLVEFDLDKYYDKKDRIEQNQAEFYRQKFLSEGIKYVGDSKSRALNYFTFRRLGLYE